MTHAASPVLDEAYERLAGCGPEWGGNLSNHGPMAAEVLARRGFEPVVPGWVDAYVRRLDELPPPREAITDDSWSAALGDLARVTDWTEYFERALAGSEWRDVLRTWWPRLLPGIAAGATHGLIRTGHAVRTLLAGDESPAARGELARGLAFWAARSTAVPGASDPAGTADPALALDAVPRLAHQDGPIAGRLARLAELPGWSDAVRGLRAASDPDSARDVLARLVDAATLRYLTHGHAAPVLLVHTATAPNAVLHTLPALPRELWPASLSAVWAASAAITAAYGPAEPAPRAELPAAPTDSDGVSEVLDRAVQHRDEHVLKFTDTAADVYERTGNPDALAAAVRVEELI